jgi:competence protein ComEA
MELDVLGLVSPRAKDRFNGRNSVKLEHDPNTIEKHKEERTMIKSRNRFLTVFVAAVLVMAFLPVVQAEDPGKVNINEATVEQLAQVKHIGPKIAERIVQYRNEAGPFKSLEDLTNVKGIGPKTFEKIKDLITI